MMYQFNEKTALKQWIDSFKIAYESIKKNLNPIQSSDRNRKKEPVSFLCAAKI